MKGQQFGPSDVAGACLAVQREMTAILIANGAVPVVVIGGPGRGDGPPLVVKQDGLTDAQVIAVLRKVANAMERQLKAPTN